MAGLLFSLIELKSLNKKLVINLTPLILLLILITVFPILNPRFLSSYNFQNIIRQSAILLIASMGQTFVIVSGSLDLSVAGVVAFCGIMTALTVNHLGPLAILVGPLVGLTIGCLQGITLTKGKIPSFLTTLGVAFILEGLTLFITKGHPIRFESSAFQSLTTTTLFEFFPVLGVWSLGIWVLATFAARYTRFGRYAYIIGGGEKVALLCGIPTTHYKVYIFSHAGLLAGLAGSLLTARMGSGYPAMGGSQLIFDTIIAVTLGGTPITGGVGGPLHTLLGVVVISILSNGLNIAAVSPYFQISIKGFVLIFAVLLTLDRTKVGLIK